MMTITSSSIALLLVVSAMSSDVSTAFGNLRSTPRKLQTYTPNDDYYQSMLKAVNAERAKAGLSALCTNSKLQAAAKRHSDDMAANNYMEHDGADGSTMSQRVTDAGYEWTAVAENVAAGQEDVASVMVSWMNSQGHRENILGADYTMFGTSYAYSESTTYKHYWTQDFGAGDTEACDGGSSTSSQTTDQTEQTQQQTQDEVAGESSTSTDYTSAPSTTAPETTDSPATTAPPATTTPVTTETPETEAPAATTSTPAMETTATKTPVTTETPETEAPAATTSTPAIETTATKTPVTTETPETEAPAATTSTPAIETTATKTLVTTETPEIEAPAAITSTPAIESPATETPGCKAKK